MNRSDIRLVICIGIAAVAVVLSLMWANAERRIADDCKERSAHLQMQIDSYEQLMDAREERIHELENEIADGEDSGDGK